MVMRRVTETDLKQIGQNLYTYLLEEHRRHYAQSEAQEGRQFNYKRASIHTGIPVATLAKYRTGERTPNLIDLRDIARWVAKQLSRQVTMDDFLTGVKTFKERTDERSA